MKSITLILFLLFGLQFTYSQVTEEWVQRYNGPGNAFDEATSIAVDKTGNVYVTGLSRGSGTDTDYTTVKYNPEGVEQWVRRYNGPGNFSDVASSIAVDTSGNVHVTGWSVGSGSFDYATIKYNSEGVEQWVRRYIGPGDGTDQATSIAVDDSGNVYVTGWSEAPSASKDYATIKYNSEGVEQWVRRYNGPGDGTDEAFSIAVDSAGNVSVTGRSNEGSGTAHDYATIKYNSEGVNQWVRRYSGLGGGTDQATSIAMDDSGNVYVTGWSEGTGTGGDYATLKYNTEGVEQWVKRYDGPGNNFDAASSIAVDDSGNAYVTGASVGGGSNDYATVKYNAVGVEQWVQRYNGPSNDDDIANSIALDNSGNVYVTGRSKVGGGSNDYATVKYNPEGGEEWVQRYNGPSNDDDIANSIALDNSGNVYVTGVSVGSGNQKDYASIKYSQSDKTISLITPSGGVTALAGSADTIRWSTSGIDTVVLFFSADASDSGATFSIIDPGWPAEAGMYIWGLPDTLSPDCIIQIEDAHDPSIFAVSDTFGVKPYILTRIDAQGDYEPFSIATDAWSFSNATAWPQSWWQQFDYATALDPNTGYNYPVAFPTWPFYARPQDFPDWPLLTDAFGLDQCYWNLPEGTYSPAALLFWKNRKGNWRGSCFGFSATSLIAFGDRSSFYTTFPWIPQFGELRSLSSGDEERKAINRLFLGQFGRDFRAYRRTKWLQPPSEMLSELRQMLLSEVRDDRFLILFSNDPGDPGAHAVVPYKIEAHQTLPDRYWIYVYDNNTPNDFTLRFLVNTNVDIWSYSAYPNWGGSRGLFLSEPMSVNYTPFQFPKTAVADAQPHPFVTQTGSMDLYFNSGSDLEISNTAGQRVGYLDSMLVEEIPDAYPIIPITGYAHPPIGFELQEESFQVSISNYQDSTAYLSVVQDSLIYNYGRKDALAGEQDRLAIGGPLSVVNPDVQARTINIQAIRIESGSERVVDLTSLEIESADSLSSEFYQNGRFQLANFGSETSYDLRLHDVSTATEAIFEHAGITVPANVAHILAPIWGNLDGQALRIYVDLGNDGSIDDSLTVMNEITAIDASDELQVPQNFALHQNHPNPFNPSTIIEFSMPTSAWVTLKVYNTLGEEVANVVSEQLSAGMYRYQWHAGNLASGLYFYRLQAGDFVQSRKMLLIR